MKRILKSRLFSFILGLIVMASIAGVYAINAGEITYKETTVSAELNNLYTRTFNKTVVETFGQAYAEHSQGNGSGTRSVSANLTPGKYIVAAIYSHGGASSNSTNYDTHDAIEVDLVCENNNCEKSQLIGYKNTYRSTATTTGTFRGLTNCAYALFYVEITGNETIRFDTLHPSLNNTWAQFMDIAVVPIVEGE